MAALCRRMMGRGHLQSHGHPLPRHLCMLQTEHIHPPCFGPPKLRHWAAKFWLHNRIHSLCRADTPEVVKQAVEEFRSATTRPAVSTCNDLITYLRHADATEVYQEMRKRDEDFHEGVLYALIVGYFAAGRVSEAMQVFKFVLHEVQRTVVSYNAVLQGMCTIGRFKEAEGFLAEMVSSDVAPDEENSYKDPYTDSYVILMGGLVGQGKLDEAARVLQVYKSSRDVRGGAVVYNVLLEAYLKAGRVVDCEEILREMAENRCNLDEEGYDLLIDGFCKQGWIDECFRSLRRFSERHYFAECLMLFPYLSDAGKLDEIRELFEEYVKDTLPIFQEYVKDRIPICLDYFDCDMMVEDIENEERAAEVRRIFQDVFEKMGVGSEEEHVATEEPNLQTQVTNVINGGQQEIERQHLGVTKPEVAAAM